MTVTSTDSVQASNSFTDTFQVTVFERCRAVRVQNTMVPGSGLTAASPQSFERWSRQNFALTATTF